MAPEFKSAVCLLHKDRLLTTLSCLYCPLRCPTARNGWLCDCGIRTVEIPPAGELNGGSCITEGNMLALCSNGLHYKA